MFEPENDIERALMRAAKEPDARPDFVRSLMDTKAAVKSRFGAVRQQPDPVTRLKFRKARGYSLRPPRAETTP